VCAVRNYPGHEDKAWGVVNGGQESGGMKDEGEEALTRL